ncbi:type II secretion system F family protein [Brucella intermedia]|uniref:type II secretion system F family protein n=1 Tax=Brucella intermedia TaxID=94625 RepID=UPI000467F5C7|nr:type II secretion system F family protein [Brucella intermedia]
MALYFAIPTLTFLLLFLLEPYIKIDQRLSKFSISRKAPSGAYASKMRASLSKRANQYYVAEAIKNDTNETLLFLRSAGLLSKDALLVYQIARSLCPLAFLCFGYLFVWYFGFLQGKPLWAVILLLGSVAGFGYYLPYLVVKNRVLKRQTSIQHAWSDALDLLLVCVESGMSMEAGLGKVADAATTLSPALSDELKLTVADFSLCPDRSSAYHRLAQRVKLQPIGAFVQCAIQSERYGTPTGQALRVLAKENRERRMLAAEKKAAALPPKLTVPMILFFLPVIFVVIMTPAIVQVVAQGGIMGGQ